MLVFDDTKGTPAEQLTEGPLAILVSMQLADELKEYERSQALQILTITRICDKCNSLLMKDEVCGICKKGDGRFF